MDLAVNAIEDAQRILNAVVSSGDEDLYKLDGEESFNFINNEVLSRQYEKELAFIKNEIFDIAKIIKSKRSTSIPISYYSSSSNLKQEYSNDFEKIESYENTFFRLLGMPSFSSVNLPTNNENATYISSSENLFYVDLDSSTLKPNSFQFIKDNVLNQRQIPKDYRTFIINDSIYKTDLDEYDDSLNIEKFESQFFYYSYLLFPPIQDGDISSNISDVEQIIAPPFLPYSQRKVNGKILKSSLLETVLRIRLDKLSGSSTFLQEEGIEINSDSYGILESLFIVRLSTVLSSLASKIDSDRDKLNELIEKNKKSDVDSDSPDPSLPDNEKQQDSAVNLRKMSLNIENALFSLIDDRGDVLDLQTDTQRTSNVYDSPLLDSIIKITDLPRQRLLKDIKEIRKGIVKSESSGIKKLKKDINEIIGTDIGIGTIDIVCFILAMFIIPEEYLLGLLTNKQFDNMKSSEFAYLVPSNVIKMDLIESINMFSKYVFDVYLFFLNKSLNSQ